MKPQSQVLSAAIATFFIGSAMPLFGAMPEHDMGGPATAKLGQVHFKVECNAAAQKEFDLAMAYYHSFAWHRYEAPLARALAADPGCGMAHWARALSILDNPFIWPGILSRARLKDVQAALDAARKTGLKSMQITPSSSSAHVALFAFSFDAALTHPSAAQEDPAARACLAGVRTEAYREASNACWIVYSSAIAVNDYASAAAAVRLGCERDKRADFCAFTSHWGVTAASVREATTSAAKYNIRRAAERAESFVTTADIEDVELQLDRAELARVLKNQKAPAARGTLARRHSDTRIAPSSRRAQPTSQ